MIRLSLIDILNYKSSQPERNYFKKLIDLISFIIYNLGHSISK